MVDGCTKGNTSKNGWKERDERKKEFERPLPFISMRMYKLNEKCVSNYGLIEKTMDDLLACHPLLFHSCPFHLSRNHSLVAGDCVQMKNSKSFSVNEDRCVPLTQ